MTVIYRDSYCLETITMVPLFLWHQSRPGYCWQRTLPEVFRNRLRN